MPEERQDANGDGGRKQGANGAAENSSQSAGDARKSAKTAKSPVLTDAISPDREVFEL